MPQSELAKRRKAYMDKLVSDYRNRSLGYQCDHLNSEAHMRQMRKIAQVQPGFTRQNARRNPKSIAAVPGRLWQDR